ncbi:htr-like protein [Halarchaeum acidiphilum MH1-52-1]|uniref:Htr-like protein n=1 Tax=Halarchaeum acidiphilum MH1-52-1 TaxID=1261545 RepID=U2YRR1_9EURY|nr:AI-2E family transporter [Halarchaeum acidiphilum]GAD51407.1 htr-like protein [Halarchaeum acidiphilum MH1-52-1]
MSSTWDVDRARLGWWVMAAVCAGVLAFVVYSFIGTFVFGVFIYYAVRPVYRRLRDRIRPPTLAAIVSLLVFALPALLLLAYAFAIGLQELNAYLSAHPTSFQQLESVLTPYVDVASIVRDPQSLLASEDALATLRGVISAAQGYLGFFGTVALHAFVMLTIAFYLLRDDARLAAWFHRRFDDAEGVVYAYAKRVDSDFSNIFFGNILNAVITAIIGAISYSLLDYVAPAGVGVPYPALLGVLTGIASLIPVVGIKLVYVPVTALLVVRAATTDPDAFWFPVLYVAVSFVVVDVVPDLVLRPYVSGRNLHLGMVMLAYIFGPLLFGWYGIFLGPMLLVLIVHFVRLVLPELLAGAPIEPKAIGPSTPTARTVQASLDDVRGIDDGADDVSGAGDAGDTEDA